MFEQQRMPNFGQIAEMVIEALVFAALCFFVYLGIKAKEIMPLQASLIVLFGGVILLLIPKFLKSIRFEPLQVESHWGGLGGGLGGWRLSRSLTYLLVLLAFSVLLIAAAKTPMTGNPNEQQLDASKPSQATGGKAQNQTPGTSQSGQSASGAPAKPTGDSKSGQDAGTAAPVQPSDATKTSPASNSPAEKKLPNSNK
jgi:hypothetical protein